MHLPRFDALENRRKEGTIRTLSITERLIDFASSDYLGLARNQILFDQIIQQYHSHKQELSGHGTRGSRLLSGNSTYAENLEKEIAGYHGYESATLFGSAYMANVGLLQAIGESCATIFYDSMVHASSRDGIRLSHCIAKPFRHNDLSHLEKQLQKVVGGCRYILVESIYSMDGSIAPLHELVKLAERYMARLIVDEAHSVGVYGNQGSGMVSELSLQDKVFAVVLSYGKAFAVGGGAVLSSLYVKDLLLNYAKTLIYTAALPGLALASIRAAYTYMPQLGYEVKNLRNLIEDKQSHIKSVIVKSTQVAKDLSKKMEIHGFEIKAIVSPTVRKGQEMLRICLHSYNTKEELDAAFDIIRGEV